MPVAPDAPDPSPPEQLGAWAPGAASRWSALLERLDRSLVCVDFDGTLAPIVDDPELAVPHPGVRQALLDLVPRVRAVAVVTGRPVEQVLRLGDVDAVADALSGRGRIEVRGQYGAERWSSTTREVQTPDPPPELERLRERLPGLLDEAGLAQAHVEDKGLALAVHARRMPDPEAATASLRELLAPLARDLGLRLEPGRAVVELRATGGDKGDAVDGLVADLDPAAVLFAGDDLGDVAGFDAVDRFREAGGAGLLVCSGSEEECELVARADVVVDGPSGVVALLAALATAGDEDHAGHGKGQK